MALRRGSGRGHDDTGAYVVLYALLLVAIFAVLAVVLDLAALRQGRRADRAAVDLAVTAGAALLDPVDPATTAAACQAAWDYIALNVDDAGGAIAPPDCATTFPAVPCDPASPATAVATYGPLQVAITSPVPDASPLMRAEVRGGDLPQAVDPTRDGQPCDRIAVQIERTRSFLFGGFVGATTGTTDIHAVGRTRLVATTEAPGVVALEPAGCDTLVASGGVDLRVSGVGAPGHLAVDSSGSGCAAGSFVIDALDTSRITAVAAGATPGSVDSRAAGLGNVAVAYDPGDITSGALTPVPAPVPSPVRRTFIDDRYGSEITQLRATLASGTPPGPYLGVPFIDYAPLPCTAVSGSPIVVPAGNYFVDCPTLLVETGGSITFLGGAVVLTGSLQVNDGGCFSLNHAGCGAVAVPQDNVLYLRAGDISKAAQGGIFLNRTLAHLTGGMSSADGRVLVGPDFTGGSSTLVWTPPSAGVFEDLSLWAESAAAMSIGGQGTTTTNGTFFAPNTTLSLGARPGGTDLGGQVVAGRVRAMGNAVLRVVTDATVATTLQARAVRLIR